MIDAVHNHFRGGISTRRWKNSQNRSFCKQYYHSSEHHVKIEFAKCQYVHAPTLQKSYFPYLQSKFLMLSMSILTCRF